MSWLVCEAVISKGTHKWLAERSWLRSDSSVESLVETRTSTLLKQQSACLEGSSLHTILRQTRSQVHDHQGIKAVNDDPS